MSIVYPSLESEEYGAAFEAVVSGISSLRELYDLRAVREGVGRQVDEDLVGAFEEVLRATNELRASVRTLVAYTTSFVATDSRNETAQAKLSELQRHLVELAKLGKRFDAWIGSLDVKALIAASPLAAEHSFALHKASSSAEHQMSEAEEDLAAALQPAGPTAWGRLHGDVSSLLLVDVPKPDGSVDRMPMSAVRGLASDPERAVREAAYRAELAAWQTVEVPMAAALNSIKGWTNVLNERRGWPDALEPALFSNNVDRGTLEAMQTAVVESFPDFRRYLRAKAGVLFTESLAWFDLFAPLGAEARRWSYDDATAFIVDRFGEYSDDLAALASRAFQQRWVDVEPREGKRDGAFCMSVRSDESRVLLNYSGSFNSVSTLAHELGHAYHNVQLARRTEFQRQTPMALAETASIFCQTIVTNAMLEASDDSERLAILEAELQGACQILVDIHSRFLFERDVFSRRAKRDLSVNELKESMLNAQRQTYGEGLDPEAMHPYMWAAKPHYYGASFYNWPYTFGMLFGLGLYAQFTQDPDRFRDGYDELLSSTGLEDARALGRRFGIDFSSPDFWRSSVDVLRRRIDDFVALAGSGAVK